MKLSTRYRYGTRAVVEIARNYQIKPTKRKDIASIQEISGPYLENILIALKSGGIVDTIRGASGGFILKRPPSEITLLDIFQSLQGKLEPVECLGNPARCSRSGDCVTRPVWEQMQRAQREVLQKTTIRDLLNKTDTKT